MIADVTVIGAGVMGAALARELAKYDLEVVVIEKGEDVCAGSSKGSCSIVWAACPGEGPLKAALTVRGNALFERMCDELEVTFRRTGMLLAVALNPEEMNMLPSIEQHLAVHPSPGARTVGTEEILEMEPHLNPEVRGAIHLPSAGIVSSYELTIALMENAVDNGVELLRNAPVANIRRKGNEWCIETPDQLIQTRFIINAAGVFADEIAALAGDTSLQISPTLIESYILDKEAGHLVSQPIDSFGRGGVVPTVHGNLMFAMTTREARKNDSVTTRDGYSMVLSHTAQLVPALYDYTPITAYGALVATKSQTTDYLIQPSQHVPSFITISACAPGISAAPAAAELVVRFLRDGGLELRRKTDFQPRRPAIPRFKNLTREAKARLIQTNHDYGQVICRCETVTKGEVLEAIRRGARTLDGVKYRTRAGMGRCQGGFCSPRVTKLLAQELGCTVPEITKKGSGSEIVPFRVKELLGKEEE